MVSGSAAKYYENLGYTIPREKSDRGLIRVPLGTKIEVCVNDLPNSSCAAIDCECDFCKKPLKNMRWVDYLNCRKDDEKIYCQKCSMYLFGKEKIKQTKLKNSVSFYDWCIQNNHIDILELWDYEKNNHTPNQVCFSTREEIYINCPRNIHESEIKSLHNFVSGKWDIYCKQCNSFDQWIYDNNKEWIFDIWSDKNNKSPNDYDWGSGKKVWWKCPEGKHDDYERELKASIKYKFHCRNCIDEMGESILQGKVRKYLNSFSEYFTINNEYDCELECRNYKTKTLLPYDNEIISDKFKAIVETHGEQHYKIGGWHVGEARRKNISSQEQFEYQQWKDEYKKQFALNNGYFYLAIPYWADDENETWKMMINDMLEFIYQSLEEN